MCDSFAVYAEFALKDAGDSLGVHVLVAVVGFVVEREDDDEVNDVE